MAKSLLKNPKTTSKSKTTEHMTVSDDKSDMAIGERIGVTITAPNFKTVELPIVGTAPYVQNAFSKKAGDMIRASQAAGSTGKKGKKHEAKDFDALFIEAQHVAREGWIGIPASALRGAMISACSLVGFHMTKAKKSIFIEADGFDRVEGTPLIRVLADPMATQPVAGTPRHVEHRVRLPSGVPDIRVRAMFDQWGAKVRVRFDADLFTPADIANLMMRAGLQVGIGEGRADSPVSKTGMGWGHFECVTG